MRTLRTAAMIGLFIFITSNFALTQTPPIITFSMMGADYPPSPGTFTFYLVSATRVYQVTVPFGPYSTASSIASAIAAKISTDCLSPANAHAYGSIIYFKSKASAPVIVSLSGFSPLIPASTQAWFFGISSITQPYIPPAQDPSCCYTVN